MGSRPVIISFWTGSPTAARTLIVLAIAACIAALAYLFLTLKLNLMLLEDALNVRVKCQKL
jgi:hypothetical protein